VRWQYVEQPRKGDHICYISDLRKLRSHFPKWRLTKGVEETIREIVHATQAHLGAAH
jgi:CDP-paratose 2-epimerase